MTVGKWINRYTDKWREIIGKADSSFFKVFPPVTNIKNSPIEIVSLEF